MPTDPWFQALFAQRLGGADYGKGTAIYKFEKIKRAKRQAVADHPRPQAARLRHRRERRHGRAVGPRPAGRRGGQAGEPRVRRQRHRRLQGGRGRVHEPAVRRRPRPGDRSLSLHRVEARLRHAAGLLHRPRRRDALDRAGVPPSPARTPATTAARSTSCRWSQRTIICPTSTPSPPTWPGARSCSSSTTRTARPGPSPPATSTGGSSTSPVKTRSSSCRTPRTSCSPTGASR